MISALYVDDEPALLEIGRIFLERTGDIRVDTAESAPVALKKLRSATYDVVISDYQMPVMDGIAFLKEIRTENTHLPFIIFTGKGREDVVIEALNCGADHYIQKGGGPKGAVCGTDPYDPPGRGTQAGKRHHPAPQPDLLRFFRAPTRR